jgi:hypothetical protein
MLQNLPRRGHRAHARASVVFLSCVLVTLLAGCTPALLSPSPSPSALPTKTGYEGHPITKAAEPGEAPAVTVQPVGRVVSLPKGTHPWGIAVADSVHSVYLAAHKQNKFVVYDMATGTVTSKAVPGAGRMIDLSVPRGSLLLPAENRATLYLLALPSLDVISSESTSTQPHEAVQVGDTTFVTEEYGHAVRALRGGKTVAHFTQPVQPGGIAAVGNRVAAVDVGANLLFVYDASTLKLIAALPAGEGPSHVVPIGGTRVAVCDVRGNAVLTYDLAGTPRALGRASVPGRAFWIGSDPATGTIFTALSNTNKIAELKVAADGTPTLIATVPTVRNPISFDRDSATGDIYVAGYADSELQIIPATAFR